MLLYLLGNVTTQYVCISSVFVLTTECATRPNILDQLFLDKLRSGKLDVKDKSKVMRFVIPFSTDMGGS